MKSLICALLLSASLFIPVIDQMPNRIHVVLFTASWCPPCKKMHPEWDKVNKHYMKDSNTWFYFNEIDTSKSSAEYSRRLKVTAVPTLVILYEEEFGKYTEISRRTGFKTCDEMIKYIEETRP